MDRHRVRLVSLGAIAFLVPIAAFAFGAQDELQRNFTLASLGDLFGGSGSTPHPEAVVLDIHKDIDVPDPRVMAFDRDYGNVQGEINEKQDIIAGIGRDVYGVDILCLDALLDDVDKLQEDLDKLYIDYITLANEQGGMVTAEQDLEFRKKCKAIRDQIQAVLYEAKAVANGISPLRCA